MSKQRENLLKLRNRSKFGRKYAVISDGLFWLLLAHNNQWWFGSQLKAKFLFDFFLLQSSKCISGSENSRSLDSNKGLWRTTIKPQSIRCGRKYSQMSMGFWSQRMWRWMLERKTFKSSTWWKYMYDYIFRNISKLKQDWNIVRHTLVQHRDTLVFIS